ncbi:hypothetical protein Ahy_B02g058448 [Arachis hypogaea]|uniref:Transposase MuDR plant domain-containing protein n=1 Tax=Arachis hypogaea TaxID=3818 RepID=A0A445AEM7_ARAHY|nr:hypothetical protein Ahy_B02g058448 [Arachis hypogaea]
MRILDLDAIHAPEFFKYVNIDGSISDNFFSIGVANLEDGEFSIEMEYNSRKSIIAAIRSYIISRGADYVVHESESQTFYAKCKRYGRGCDWLIQISLICKKDCWEIRRYNGKHTCFIGTISHYYSNYI